MAYCLELINGTILKIELQTQKLLKLLGSFVKVILSVLDFVGCCKYILVDDVELVHSISSNLARVIEIRHCK